MSKVKKAFYCQSCGYESAKWLGKCPSCQAWNSFEEEILSKPSAMGSEAQNMVSGKGRGPVLLKDVAAGDQQRIPLPDAQFNRVLGGGIVPGAVIMLGGEPGVGKSTLLLQSAMQFDGKLAYVSGEESPVQIRMRAERLGKIPEELYLVTETGVERLLHELEKIQPQMIVIDSIQTLHSQLIESVPGSISQIRACAAELMKYAKLTATPVLLVGHINKEGQLAGPKVLEHMVDVVLQFEGDAGNWFRMMRAHKNRFGSVHEIALYEMQQGGLIAIDNPGEYLLSGSAGGLSGVALGITMEGMQALMLELQALVSTAAYGTPQRSATGFDVKRLNMLLAVLEKRCGFKTATQDVFLNIGGGFKVADTALDLAVVAAILSSRADVPLNNKGCFLGEVSLSGEIRPVQKAEKRLSEAARLGYKQAVISGYQNLSESIPGMEIKKFDRLDQFYTRFFE